MVVLPPEPELSRLSFAEPDALRSQDLSPQPSMRRGRYLAATLKILGHAHHFVVDVGKYVEQMGQLDFQT